MHSSASVALETAATIYNAVGGYPTTITSYADRRLSPIVDSEPDVSISDNESSGEEEYDTIEDTNQPLVDEEKIIAKGPRPEVRVNYDALDSDGPSDDEQDTDPDFEEDIHFVDTSAAWTDAALADYMAEAGGDMNDDDTLLKIAKNRNEIKAWQENGWDLGKRDQEKSCVSQNEYRGLYKGEWGPTPESLFKHIADESNRHAAQIVIPRAQKIKKQQEKNKRSGVRSRDVESTK
ncbi:Hypothetical protein PHPALM_36396 [Phytophthora palmivora]|uniref:Uncharacterized protein n=1 Tax=Phytophthora palmivora TaxID=4796 RepID=A0A2P4X021_9STRA|nr:Hypothetical protein PHPALM_36396 [Phytophthora palmivora]